MIKALPSMEHTFTVDIKGSETGTSFTGSFTYKRPNLRTKSEIQKTAAILDGGVVTLDEDTKFLHSVLATLKHTLIKYPDWYKESDFGYELYDVNVLIDLYRECNEFEKKWFAQVWEGKDPAEDKKAK